jgi:hypothetical protein
MLEGFWPGRLICGLYRACGQQNLEWIIKLNPPVSGNRVQQLRVSPESRPIMLTPVFDCGQEKLKRLLSRFALVNVRTGAAQTYAACSGRRLSAHSAERLARYTRWPSRMETSHRGAIRDVVSANRAQRRAAPRAFSLMSAPG